LPIYNEKCIAINVRLPYKWVTSHSLLIWLKTLKKELNWMLTGISFWLFYDLNYIYNIIFVWRQAATVASSICVYTIAWIIFSRKGDSIITKEDSDSFTVSFCIHFLKANEEINEFCKNLVKQLIVYIVCAIGVVFSILFNVFVKEVKASTPTTNTSNQSLYNSSDDLVNNNQYRKRVCSVSSVYECKGKDECLKDYTTSKTSFPSGNTEIGNIKSSNAYKWSDWLKNLNFYKIVWILIIILEKSHFN